MQPTCSNTGIPQACARLWPDSGSPAVTHASTLSGMSDGVLDGLGTNPAFPQDLLRRLIAWRHGFGRVAERADLTAELVEEMIATDWFWLLTSLAGNRAGAVRHLALTVESAARLAGDRDFQVRHELARHPGLPPEVRDRLASDDSATVQVAVFAREDTPEPLRALIHDEVHRKDAAFSDDLDDLALLQFVGDREAVGELRRMPLPWVTADPLRHVGSPYVPVRIAVAVAAATLPPAVVDRLLADEEPRVPETVVEHAPHLVDEATAERIERAHRPPHKWRRPRPADTYPFTPDTLRRFAADPDPRMRVLALRAPGGPDRALAADPVAAVRLAAAVHPGMPASVLVELLDDADEEVAVAAAAHPGLPVEAMADLLRRAGL
jgi:hypothetical protein